MAEQTLGIINPVELLDVGFVVQRPNDPFDALIGDERTDNLYAAWQSIASEYQVPLMAYFHAFDTESRKTFRVPIDNHNIEKGLIKVKLNQSERLRTLMRTGVVPDQFNDYVLNDAVRLADQVVTRTKVAKAEMLAYGKVTIEENNLKLPIDYGVPTDQFIADFDLSAKADIIGQLQDLLDKAAAKGVTLTGLATARNIITKMRQNASIQGAINGALMQGQLVTRAAFNAFMEDEFGISNIVTNDLNYAVEDGIDETTGRPKVKQYRYYPKNKMSFFAANPGGRIGTCLWGDPPEIDLRLAAVTNAAGEKPFVYVTQYEENDPAVLWTKASALAVPVLYNPNSLWVATEKAGE